MGIDRLAICAALINYAKVIFGDQANSSLEFVNFTVDCIVTNDNYVSLVMNPENPSEGHTESQNKHE